MKTITDTEAKNNLGAAMDSALVEPVMIESMLKQFAERVGGKYSLTPGISDEEIRTSKSELSKWFDKSVLDPVLCLFGQSLETGKNEWAEHIKNAYVDCDYRNWSIRFHIRNHNFDFHTPGTLRLRITCPITRCDLRFYLTRKEEKITRADVAPVREGFVVPCYLKPLIPEGILMSLEPELLTFLVQLHSEQLDDIYIARATDQSVAERLLHDHRVQDYLMQLGGVYFWRIGYCDPNGTNDRLFELNERIGLSLEPLEVSLRLTQTMLDLLFLPALYDAENMK